MWHTVAVKTPSGRTASEQYVSRTAVLRAHVVPATASTRVRLRWLRTSHLRVLCELRRGCAEAGAAQKQQQQQHAGPAFVRNFLTKADVVTRAGRGDPAPLDPANLPDTRPEEEGPEDAETKVRALPHLSYWKSGACDVAAKNRSTSCSVVVGLLQKSSQPAARAFLAQSTAATSVQRRRPRRFRARRSAPCSAARARSAASSVPERRVHGAHVQYAKHWPTCHRGCAGAAGGAGADVPGQRPRRRPGAAPLF